MDIDLGLLCEPFVVRAFLSAIVGGLVCGLLGVFLVLRKISLAGEGMAHSAFAGIAIGTLLGITTHTALFIFCIIIGTLLAYLTNHKKIQSDASAGILFSATIALGVVILSRKDDMSGNTLKFLFGSILTISNYDLYWSCALMITTLLVTFFYRKELLYSSLDSEQSHIVGVKTNFTNYVFYLLLSLTIVITFNLVGTILMSSLLIIPATISLLFVKDAHQALLVSPLLGVIIAVLGLFTSFLFNTPPGATVALVGVLAYLFSILGKRL